MNSRILFLMAALFNWIVAAGLFFMPQLFLKIFHITPQILHPSWVQQFATLVLAFGIGYYWAFTDFERNVQIVRLAVIAKLGVVATAIYTVVAGSISWQMLIPASCDFVFAILFIVALRRFDS